MNWICVCDRRRSVANIHFAWIFYIFSFHQGVFSITQIQYSNVIVTIFNSCQNISLSCTISHWSELWVPEQLDIAPFPPHLFHCIHTYFRNGKRLIVTILQLYDNCLLAAFTYLLVRRKLIFRFPLISYECMTHNVVNTSVDFWYFAAVAMLTCWSNAQLSIKS